MFFLNTVYIVKEIVAIVNYGNKRFIIAARCYAQARPMPSCGVCLSGWLVSVTFVYSVETAKDTAIVAMAYE